MFSEQVTYIEINDDPSDVLKEALAERIPKLQSVPQLLDQIVDVVSGFAQPATQDNAQAIRYVLNLISSASKPILTVDCLRVALNMEDRSMRCLADVHNVSVETISNLVDSLIAEFNLPRARAQVSQEARVSYSQVKRVKSKTAKMPCKWLAEKAFKK